LRRLRANPDPAPSVSASPSLAERIRRLSTAGPTRIQARASPEAIADGLGAELLEPGLLSLERRQPLTRRHGRFQPAQGLACVSASAADPSKPDPSKPDPSEPDPSEPDLGDPDLNDLALPAAEGWRFLDTETSGLAGGTGTWAFVVGVGQIQGGELRTRQYLLLDLGAEAALMERVQTELAAADPLISYNGKTFDLPLLETRLRLNGLPGCSDRLAHLDLLYLVRRAFAGRWPDCRLLSCEQRLLGFERDDDLPGAEAPAAWLDWLRDGDPARLGAVLRHNRLDLHSLAALLPALLEVQRQPQRYDADLASLARHLERRGRATGAEQLLEAARVATGSALEPAAALALARLKRRRGAWQEAADLWEPLAAVGEPRALVELAKYHEHVRGDLARALAYAEQLPETDEHAHRRARLQRRLVLSGRAQRAGSEQLLKGIRAGAAALR
jgi:uncharacterized protein YprB with RNaseH-like and TPR domain